MEAIRLRNLTTGRLHTEMGHIYEDLELITGMKGLMTHMLPRALKSVEPWLRAVVTSREYWDGEFNPDAEGHFILRDATKEEQAEMVAIYMDQPRPFAFE